MLELFYKERRALVDCRQGLLGPHFDGFAAHLKKAGYHPVVAQTFLRHCRRFNAFATAKGIPACERIGFAHMRSFLRAQTGSTAKKMARRAVVCLFRYLVEVGVLREEAPQRISRNAWILDPYFKYLKDERQLTETSFRQAQKHIFDFLGFLGNEVASSTRFKFLKPTSVETYLRKQIDVKRAGLTRIVSNLRVFLRFCARGKFIRRDLSGIFPAVPRYRLSSLPKGMEESDLRKILKVIDATSSCGRRDYAVTLLMMIYGMRGSQAAALQLHDISWSRSTIRIPPGKNGKEVVLPLLEPVGEAILRYLRYRPQCPSRHVFITVRAPHRPLTDLVVSMLVRRRMAKAGVKVLRSGSSTFRHSWAIRALAHGASIKSIADVLGHRYLGTTLVYAKADLKMLRQVTLPWPEVRS
ncbi:MAG: site-specific integrase [Candidatus Omnitrophota bacterium]